ncbi:MAG TPA: hypothetical protein VKN36_15285 [Eudoraea sp.]|nr:hypothetical protein [Eudoraea sp.]
MAERLVVLSDMWGAKKGMWITSYLGYLQQYFDIVFYDSKHLADLDILVYSPENVYEAFVNDGMKTAVAQILKKEVVPSHYLTFCAGGTIAWHAARKGLPIKSLYAVSPIDLHLEHNKPEVPMKLLYGEYQQPIPSEEWAGQLDIDMEIVPKFGNELYMDEKIIQKVCLFLLETMLKKQYAGL